MKLENKINLYTAVLFVAIVILMNFTIYYLFKNLMIESEKTAAQTEIDSLSTRVTSSIGEIEIDMLLRAYVPVDGGIQVVLEDENLAGMVTSPTEQDLSSLNKTFYPNEQNKTIIVSDTHYYFYSTPIIWTDGTIANLQVVKSIQTPYHQLEVLRLVLIAVSIIAMIPMIVSSRLLTKFIMHPITSMTNTMREITKSGQFKKIQIEDQHSQDELYQMADTFNHMMELLESNFSKQEQFVSNASHELKTPLTVIESYASLLKRRGLEKPEVFTESIEAIHSEAIRMKEMTEQLLLLAKPHEQWDIQLVELDFNDLITETIKSFRNAYQREIIFNELAAIKIVSDGQKLKQLIYIILENAVKYSDEKIIVEVATEEQESYLRIMDRGIGIPQEDIPKLFDRFYRVDKARARKFGGTGLGLSLAKEISDAIQARIQIESTLGLGTSVTLYLPNRSILDSK